MAFVRAHRLPEPPRARASIPTPASTASPTAWTTAVTGAAAFLVVKPLTAVRLRRRLDPAAAVRGGRRDVRRDSPSTRSSAGWPATALAGPSPAMPSTPAASSSRSSAPSSRGSSPSSACGSARPTATAPSSPAHSPGWRIFVAAWLILWYASIRLWRRDAAAHARPVVAAPGRGGRPPRGRLPQRPTSRPARRCPSRLAWPCRCSARRARWRSSTTAATSVTSDLVAVDLHDSAPTPDPTSLATLPHLRMPLYAVPGHPNTQQRDRRRLAVAGLVHDPLDRRSCSASPISPRGAAHAGGRVRRRSRRRARSTRCSTRSTGGRPSPPSRRPSAACARGPTPARRPTRCSSASTRSTSSAHSPAAASSRPPSRRSCGSPSATRSSPATTCSWRTRSPGRLWVALGGGPIIRNGIALLRGLQQHINDHGAVPSARLDVDVHVSVSFGYAAHQVDDFTFDGLMSHGARAARRRPGLARSVQRRQPALLRHPARGHHRRAGDAGDRRRRPEPAPEDRSSRDGHGRSPRTSCRSPTSTRGHVEALIVSTGWQRSFGSLDLAEPDATSARSSTGRRSWPARRPASCSND